MFQSLIQRMENVRMSLVEEGEVPVKLQETDLEASNITMKVAANSHEWGPQLPDPLWSTQDNAFVKVPKILCCIMALFCSILITKFHNLMNMFLFSEHWLFWSPSSGWLPHVQTTLLPKISHGGSCTETRICQWLLWLLHCHGASCREAVSWFREWRRNRHILPGIPARQYLLWSVTITGNFERIWHFEQMFWLLMFTCYLTQMLLSFSETAFFLLSFPCEQLFAL